MDSVWSSNIESLNESVAALRGSITTLNSARPVDMSDVLEHLNKGAESARNLRSLILEEMPDASWESRPDLDNLIDEVQRRIAARELERRRNRLLDLASELEQGNISHRRAVRVKQLNELRELAILELRTEAGSDGAVQTLPGPEADAWIPWACALKEPEDTEALQTLRNEFTHLDEFVANLEPNMWAAKAETTA